MGPTTLLYKPKRTSTLKYFSSVLQGPLVFTINPFQSTKFRELPFRELKVLFSRGQLFVSIVIPPTPLLEVSTSRARIVTPLCSTHSIAFDTEVTPFLKQGEGHDQGSPTTRLDVLIVDPRRNHLFRHTGLQLQTLRVLSIALLDILVVENARGTDTHFLLLLGRTFRLFGRSLPLARTTSQGLIQGLERTRHNAQVRIRALGSCALHLVILLVDDKRLELLYALDPTTKESQGLGTYLVLKGPIDAITCHVTIRGELRLSVFELPSIDPPELLSKASSLTDCLLLERLALDNELATFASPNYCVERESLDIPLPPLDNLRLTLSQDLQHVQKRSIDDLNQMTMILLNNKGRLALEMPLVLVDTYTASSILNHVLQ